MTKDEMKEYMRQYYRLNRERLCEYARVYRQANGERLRQYARAKSRRAQGWHDVEQVERELGYAHLTEVCRQCGNRLPPMRRRRAYNSYCDVLCYRQAFRYYR